MCMHARANPPVALTRSDAPARQITDLRDAEAHMYDNHIKVSPFGKVLLCVIALWAGFGAMLIWAAS